MSLTDKIERKRKFLIATHGDFSTGVKSSLDMIIGVIENLSIIRAYVDENTSIEQELQIVLDDLGEHDELIVFSDILGGSVTNQAITQALKQNVHIISGFNLPLLIEVLMADMDTPIEQMIRESIDNAREQMVYVNKLLTANTTSNDD